MIDENSLERIPLAEEQLVVGKRRIETGAVRVHIDVESSTVMVRAPLEQDRFEVERVAIGRRVDERPVERMEGDVRIIPIVEEVAVVTTHLELREEIRIRRITTTSDFEQPVVLRAETARIERTESGAQPTPNTKE